MTGKLKVLLDRASSTVLADVPFMIGRMANAEAYDKARRHLLGLGAKGGVDFGH